MAFHKTEGLIYRIKNFKDADKILWILTPYHGKITAIAKGVRKMNSRRGGHIDLFNLCEFGLNQGSSMPVVSEAKVINGYNQVKEACTYAIFYLAELIDKATVDEDDTKQILTKLKQLLSIASEESINYLIASFELHLLKALGLEPELSNFLDTNTKLTVDSSFYISYNAPGYESQGSIDNEVSINVIKAQRFYISHSISDTITLKIDDITYKQLNLANKIWLQNALETKFKSMQFLGTQKSL